MKKFSQFINENNDGDAQFLRKYFNHYNDGSISNIGKINTLEGEKLGFEVDNTTIPFKVFWDDSSQTVCIEKDGEISEAPYIDTNSGIYRFAKDNAKTNKEYYKNKK